MAILYRITPLFLWKNHETGTKKALLLLSAECPDVFLIRYETAREILLFSPAAVLRKSVPEYPVHRSHRQP